MSLPMNRRPESLNGVRSALREALGIQFDEGCPSVAREPVGRHSEGRPSQEHPLDLRRTNLNVTIPRDPCTDSTGHHRTERPENVDPPRHDL